MPRTPRRFQLADDVCYHRINRGHNRETVFRDDPDRLASRCGRRRRISPSAARPSRATAPEESRSAASRWSDPNFDVRYRSGRGSVNCHRFSNTKTSVPQLDIWETWLRQLRKQDVESSWNSGQPSECGKGLKGNPEGLGERQGRLATKHDRPHSNHGWPR